MPSTFTPAIRAELIADNEQAGSWGQTTNRNYTQVFEEAIVATTEIDVTAADVALTAINGGSDQSRRPYVRVLGAPAVPRVVTAADVNKNYMVSNTTGQDLTFKGLGQTGVVIPAGETAFVRLRQGDSAQQVRLAALGGPVTFSQVKAEGNTTDPLPLLLVNQLGTGPVAKFQVGGVDVLTVDDGVTTFAKPVAFPAVLGGGFLPLGGGVLSGNLRENRADSAQFLLNVTNAGANRHYASWQATSAGDMMIGYTNDAQSDWVGGIWIKADSKLYDLATRRTITLDQADGGGYLPLAGGLVTGPITLQRSSYVYEDFYGPGHAAGNKRGRVVLIDGGMDLCRLDDAGGSVTAGIGVRGANNLVTLPNSYAIWHTGNMGNNSGLNADMLWGARPDAGSSAWSIVQRNGSADINASGIYASWGLSGGPGAGGVIRGRDGGSMIQFHWSGDSHLYFMVDANGTYRQLQTNYDVSSGFGVASGWARTAGGLIVQWLRANQNDDGYSNYTLPIAFPSNIGNAVVSPNPGFAMTGNAMMSAHCNIASTSQIVVGICANFTANNVQFSAMITGW